TPDRFVARCDHTPTYRPAVTPDHRKRLVVSSSRHQPVSDPSGKPLTRERLRPPDDQALICTPRGQWLVLAIATLGSIAATAIALFGTWVAPKRGWFLALGYLGVLASL